MNMKQFKATDGMLTNQKMAQRTALILVTMLKRYGIKVTPYCTDLKPIETVLRASWYVDKIKQAGHTDCIYIGTECGFFVILENCEIMVGQNIMVTDAVTSLVLSCTDFVDGADVCDVWQMFRWHGWADEPYCEDYVAFFEISQFRELLNKLNFINL